jgi:uncharacterized protein YyaL (SSP411 family)
MERFVPNQLAHENSPYLLQHADNPVDWYPWNEEALTRARAEDKPILLSIGYAACHWCHVMAHESFEDPATGAFMNDHFINIKVDREERPDLDAIYMQAVVAMTGQGGWPMTVFLTPEGKPFYGGTYYPPVPRFGMPSFRQLLAGIVEAWRNKREDVEKSAADISGHLGRTAVLAGDEQILEKPMFARAAQMLDGQFDRTWGGFGRAPKFPPSMTIEFLLRHYLETADEQALQMATLTLDKMAYGGMYDQVGGGFARYSTDERWLVPHFEKMLYDNALLARAYLHAYQVTGRDLYKQVVTETLDFVIRELRHEDGGFYSSYDADSEGEEGKFYVWSEKEIDRLLGDGAMLFKAYYGVTKQGNWEESNILNVHREPAEIAAAFEMTPEEMAERLTTARETLYAARSLRVWPGLDDKVLTSWNGLMLAAFAEAGRVLGRADYTAVAEANAAFLQQTMTTENGRLLRTWKAGGAAKYNGYLEDYAYLADGLLALYQTTFSPRWFHWAYQLTEMMLTHFLDIEHGGFFDTSDDHEALLHRPKEVQDNATPSANAMAAGVLLRMSLYTGDGRFWDIAAEMVRAMYGPMLQYPQAFGHWLGAAQFILGEPQELAIAGDPDAADTQALLEVANDAYRPYLLTAVGEGETVVPLLAERGRRDGRATAYLCRRFVCQKPVTQLEALRKQLQS